jgi:hypothetical protein
MNIFEPAGVTLHQTHFNAGLAQRDHLNTLNQVCRFGVEYLCLAL